jgi:hypothetical protein
MQANHFESGKAASGARKVRPFATILASVPLIATLALCAPDRALAGCGAAPSAGGGGTHTGVGGGAHPAGGGAHPAGGGGGCANGSALALHALPMAASGRVLAGGVPAHAVTSKRTATTRTATTSTVARAAPTTIANAGAHFGGVKPARVIVRR